MPKPALIQAARKGDRRAQKELFAYCYDLLMGVCMRYEKDEYQARAMLNMAFLKILKNLHKYSLESPFDAWARRIAVNTLIDSYRKQRREHEKVMYVDFSDGANQHLAGVDYNEVEQTLSREAVEQMLQQLPETARRVFNLYVMEGYKHAEIAALLGFTESTSRWHLGVARKQLKAMLQRAMAEEQVIVRTLKSTL